jgi:hypothetical protein
MNHTQIAYTDAIDGIEANQLVIEAFTKLIEDKNDEHDLKFLQEIIEMQEYQNRKYNRTIRDIEENFPECILFF